MPTVVIHHINRDAVLHSADYHWLLERLHEELEIFGLHYWRSSQAICSFAVFKDDGCISIFPNELNITYTLGGTP